ncbi:MAG: hypothetical protein V3V33_14440 [Candidatus Lokiarchaeia archaeon]
MEDYNFHLLICKHIFKLSYYSSELSASEAYFKKNLFPGVKIDDIWRNYYRNGDNYLGES